MKKDKLSTVFEVAEDQVSKAIKAAGYDHKALEFSTDQVLQIEKILAWVKEGKSFKEAEKLLQAETEQRKKDPSFQLTPELIEFISQNAGAVGEATIRDLPNLIKKFKASTQSIAAQSFFQQAQAIGESPEMKQAFAQLMAEDTIDVQVLPGEPSALPESSS